MPNEFVKTRLEGLLGAMSAQYKAGSASASAAKGAGRAEFIRSFLSRVNGPAFRIQESAEITDLKGKKSGEVDIVLENGHSPNLPMLDGESARLHFAEGVGAAIEVKSTLSGQWEQALQTGEKIAELSRKFSGATFSAPGKPHIIQLPVKFKDPSPLRKQENDPYPYSKRIPFFLVGYTGWSSLETLQRKVTENERIFAGVLQIDPPMYVGSKHLSNLQTTGPWSLLCFMADLHSAFAHIKGATFDILDYGRNLQREE